MSVCREMIESRNGLSLSNSVVYVLTCLLTVAIRLAPEMMLALSAHASVEKLHRSNGWRGLAEWIVNIFLGPRMATLNYVVLRSQIESVVSSNYLSTHFFVSRILHQLIRPDGGKVKYSHLVSFMAEGFGPGVGNYSPVLFRSFKSRS